MLLLLLLSGSLRGKCHLLASGVITLDGKSRGIEGYLALYSNYATVRVTLLTQFHFTSFTGKMMHNPATNVAMHSCDAATFLQRKAHHSLQILDCIIRQ